MTDEERAGALVERLLGDVLGTVSIFSVYLGDRLGLYSALANGGPATAAELAARAGVAERYAREWLEQQAVNELLEVAEASDDGARRRYALPAAHAAVLADRDSMTYFAPFARLSGVVDTQLPALLKAYRMGGGVAWGAFGADMREAQGDANRPMFLRQLAQEQLPQIADVHARLQAAPAARVADVGCGMGWSSIAIALGYPGVTVDGYDIDEPSVEAAREHGVADRMRFHAEDPGEASGGCDLVTAVECIHDMPRPVEVLATMRRLAASGGTVLVMDERVAETFGADGSIGDTIERLMYGYSLLVCLPDGMSHTPTAATGTVMRPATLRAYEQAAGFADIEVLPVANDFFRFYRLHG
ncbi:MAG: class I SAM-dependent methyltransferase [Chloroflexi bacterium]|nr:class I SAM-dependent methyltransferase [Chloroflexota bacterium]